MSLSLKFYQDARARDCSYLPEQQSQNLYPDPSHPMTNTLYSELIQFGFRRSGNSSYRPHCPACTACVPVRINLLQFKVSRSQRRCLKRNEFITVHHQPAKFSPEQYALYVRYLTTLHPGGGMDNPTEESYQQFLLSYWSETQFLEFRDGDSLIGVAVTDYVDNALSAFYTFFEPEYRANSLGTYAILKQIALAQSLNLPYLYLGYWIADCQKMRYKANFSAVEGYIDRQWQTLAS
jgi:arginyl-tRNA--protein-N-Asp/Glu arginylyltransferase